MSSVANGYAEAKTKVFWDVGDCPIPDGLDPESVYQNSRTALARNGYPGEVSIVAYGDKNQIPDNYESAGIQIKLEGHKLVRMFSMQLDMFWWDKNNELSNLMVISQDGQEFANGLKNTILFANLENGPCTCGTWVWETLAAGGDPITET